MNAAMKEEVRVQVNEGQLLRNARFAFTNRAMIIRELLQNGRRAGATHITISTPAEDVLVVEDDGCGISDMQSLLTVAESGWAPETRDAETPYGMGWLTTLYFADHIRVQSGNKVLSAETADLLDLKSVAIETVDSVIEGTRIEARGGQLKGVIEQLRLNSRFGSEFERTEIQGFPIAVVLNGIEADRSDALDASFESFACGSIRLPLESIKQGQLDPVVYLQGIRITGNFGNTIVCHLDTRQFIGRMPDRTTLVEQSEAMTTIRKAIVALAKTKLALEKQCMDGAQFVKQYGNVCARYSELSDLLNDIEWLPAGWFVDLDRITCDSRNRTGLATQSGLLSRSEIETAGVLPTSEDDADSGFILSTFAKANRMFAVETGIHDEVGRLHVDHWLRALIKHYSRDAFSIQIEGETGRCWDYAGSGEVGVVACAAYSLSHPTLGSIRITDQNLFTGSDSGEEPSGNEDSRIPSGLVLMTTANDEVAEQISDFEVDDCYSETEEEGIRSTLRRLYAQASKADPASIYRVELEAARMEHVASGECHGKSFLVTYNDRGGLASVVVQYP